MPPLICSKLISWKTNWLTIIIWPLTHTYIHTHSIDIQRNLNTISKPNLHSPSTRPKRQFQIPKIILCFCCSRFRFRFDYLYKIVAYFQASFKSMLPFDFDAKTDIGTEPISFLFTYFWSRFKALIPYIKILSIHLKTIFLYLFITLSNLKKNQTQIFQLYFRL